MATVTDHAAIPTLERIALARQLPLAGECGTYDPLTAVLHAVHSIEPTRSRTLHPRS